VFLIFILLSVVLSASGTFAFLPSRKFCTDFGIISLLQFTALFYATPKTQVSQYQRKSSLTNYPSSRVSYKLFVQDVRICLCDVLFSTLNVVLQVLITFFVIIGSEYVYLLFRRECIFSSRQYAPNVIVTELAHHESCQFMLMIQIV